MSANKKNEAFRGGCAAGHPLYPLRGGDFLVKKFLDLAVARGFLEGKPRGNYTNKRFLKM